MKDDLVGMTSHRERGCGSLESPRANPTTTRQQTDTDCMTLATGTAENELSVAAVGGTVCLRSHQHFCLILPRFLSCSQLVNIFGRGSQNQAILIATASETERRKKTVAARKFRSSNKVVFISVGH